MRDSIPLQDEGCDQQFPTLQVSNVKLIIALFIIFIIVVSDVFTNSVITCFGEKTMCGRNPTSWGIVLQGIFLVIFYVIAIYLIEHQIL